MGLKKWPCHTTSLEHINNFNATLRQSKETFACVWAATSEIARAGLAITPFYKFNLHHREVHKNLHD